MRKKLIDEGVTQNHDFIEIDFVEFSRKAKWSNYFGININFYIVD